MIKHPRHVSHKSLRIANMITSINNKLLVFAHFFYLMMVIFQIGVIDSVKIILNNFIFRSSEWHCLWNYFPKSEIKAANLPRYITSKKFSGSLEHVCNNGNLFSPSLRGTAKLGIVLRSFIFFLLLIFVCYLVYIFSAFVFLLFLLSLTKLFFDKKF